MQSDDCLMRRNINKICEFLNIRDKTLVQLFMEINNSAETNIRPEIHSDGLKVTYSIIAKWLSMYEFGYLETVKHLQHRYINQIFTDVTNTPVVNVIEALSDALAKHTYDCCDERCDYKNSVPHPLQMILDGQ
jgi:hypothetical protein